MAPDVNDHAMVQQTVEDRRHDHRIMKQLRPIAEGLVGSDHDARLFVACRDEAVEQVTLLPTDGHIADFVDHHKRCSQVTAASSALARDVIFLEFLDQIRHCRIEDRLARLSALDRKCHGQVRFSDPRRSEEQRVVMAGKERQIEQGGDLLTVQTGLEGKVEVVERL